MTARVLIIDIETAPKIAYVWRFFKENVGAKQVKEHGHIMSFAAKWLNEDGTFYMENRGSNDKAIVTALVTLLDEADIVVAHNGVKFDISQIKARAIVHRLKPPSPFKQVDTYLLARKEFGFPSNSLEYLSEVLNLKHKKSGHKKFPGFELWLECLRNNEEAWAELKEYNIKDILALEELYLVLKPWGIGHPNVAITQEGDKVRCPKCGSDHFQYRGFAYTQVGKYHRINCLDCGGWSRTRYTLLPKNENILVN